MNRSALGERVVLVVVVGFFFFFVFQVLGKPDKIYVQDMTIILRYKIVKCLIFGLADFNLKNNCSLRFPL